MKIAAITKLTGELVYIIDFIKGSQGIHVISVSTKTGSLVSYSLSELQVVDKDYRW